MSGPCRARGGGLQGPERELRTMCGREARAQEGPPVSLLGAAGGGRCRGSFHPGRSCCPRPGDGARASPRCRGGRWNPAPPSRGGREGH